MTCEEGTCLQTSAVLNETRKGADWALLRAGSESL